MSDSLISEWRTTDERIQVGRFTYGCPIVKLWAAHERLSVGSFCSIADGVTIFGGGEHNTDWVTTYPLRIALGDPLAGRDGHPHTRGPTIIGHDVWIGDGALILSGIRVGNGAVIGARSVVTRDVPAYHVVAGNPARIVRARFPVEQIAALEAIAWWNWSIEDIRASVPHLCSADIQGFIDRNLDKAVRSLGHG